MMVVVVGLFGEGVLADCAYCTSELDCVGSFTSCEDFEGYVPGTNFWCDGTAPGGGSTWHDLRAMPDSSSGNCINAYGIVQNDVKLDSNYAFESRVNSRSDGSSTGYHGGYVFINDNVGGAPNELWNRYYIYVPSANYYTGSGSHCNHHNFLSDGAGAYPAIDMRHYFWQRDGVGNSDYLPGTGDDGKLYIGIHANSQSGGEHFQAGGQTYQEGPPDFALSDHFDEWISVEWYLNDITKQMKLWINGIQTVDTGSTMSYSKTPTGFQIGQYNCLNNDVGTTWKIYIDNIAVSTTGYIGPLIEGVFECSDSIDNDGDGQTDMADDGCSSTSDNDESNCGDGVCEGGEECGNSNSPPECIDDCGICPSSATCTDLVLLHHYDNDAIDSSGNGNDGIVNGGTWTTGKFGNAVNFDGIEGNNVEVGVLTQMGPSSSYLGDFSGATWIYINSLPRSYNTILSAASGSDGWFFYVQKSTTNRLSFVNFNTGQGIYDITTNLSYGVWYHVAFTWNAANNVISIYLDGNKVNLAGMAEPVVQSNEPFKIGDVTYHDSEWNGRIDDMAIWNRLLTDQEISGLYNAGIPLPCDSTSTCSSEADTSGDSVVDINELINYIGEWKVGDVLIGDLIDAIGEWKSGC